mmetsp:Transcript_41305/g.98909  ORF Transcript_41305/g.98909 Transcript_41305/m.98909 type:complete len:486 (-) Transcript_41305:758-2215(-)
MRPNVCSMVSWTVKKFPEATTAALAASLLEGPASHSFHFCRLRSALFSCVPSSLSGSSLGSLVTRLSKSKTMTSRFFGTSPACSPHSAEFIEGDASQEVTITRTSTTTTTTTTTPDNDTENSSSLSSSQSYVYDPKSVDATRLVDDLLLYTRSLMDEDDSRDVVGQSHRLRRHVVAFSGGIDSSVVAALVNRCCNDSTVATTVTTSIIDGNKFDHRSSAVAVLGLSPAVPTDQIELAERVAEHIGIDLEQIPTSEGTDEQYISNSGQACLACKTHLYTCLSSIAERYNMTNNDASNGGNGKGVGVGVGDSDVDNSIGIRLYNGTNADDLKDPTRLGLIAAMNFNVKSPLEHTPKHLVRVAGRHLGLPNWNYAASPCLRSRLALGVQALPEHLQRIEKAEAYVRQELQLDVTNNLRVRLLSKNRAMVEVDEELLELAQIEVQKWRQNGFFTATKISEINSKGGDYVGGLGFDSVYVRAFKTGSVAI